jgi:hypothetical protein
VLFSGTKKAAAGYLPPEGIFAAEALNFRVRNGIGCVRLAIAAAETKRNGTERRESREGRPPENRMPLSLSCQNRRELRETPKRKDRLPGKSRKRTESSGYWSDLPLPVARPAAIVHRTGDLPVPLPPFGVGGLLSGTASRLDALSDYPCRGRLPGGATGVTARPP